MRRVGCPQFSHNPEHHISVGRATLFSSSQCRPALSIRSAPTFVRSTDYLFQGVAIMPTLTKLSFTLVIVLVLSFAAAGEVRADAIVFSNFGPGMTFNVPQAWNVSGTNFFGGRVVAQSFTPTVNVAFSSAQLPMGIINGPNLLQVLLMTSSGGLPSTIVEAITLTDAVAPIGT